MSDLTDKVMRAWPADEAAWRKAAEASLKGASLRALLDKTTPDGVAFDALAGVSGASRHVKTRGEFEIGVHKDGEGFDHIHNPSGEVRSLEPWCGTADRHWAVGAEAADVAGAGPATSVGVILARLIAALRAFENAGAGLVGMVVRGRLVMPVDAHAPSAVAALRALRRSMHKVLHHCDVKDAAPRIQGVTSARMLSGQDPDTNMVRNAIAAFAAAVGGADIVVVRRHDRDEPDAERIALNTARLLLHESRLDAPGDPAAGAPFFEELTDAIARRAWAVMREIDSAGGAFAAEGLARMNALVQADHAERVRRIKEGEEIIGVTAFPPPKPKPEAAQGVDAVARRAGRLVQGGAA